MKNIALGGGGKVILYIDGAARGNPGHAGIGVVLFWAPPSAGPLKRGGQAGGERIQSFSEYIGETTNNIAEYSALIYGLERALKIPGGVELIEICSDSELLVRQLEGAYRVKNQNLKVFFGRVKALLSRFKEANISHISREKNAEADGLANKAIDDYLAGEKSQKRLEGIPEQKSLF